MSTSTVKHSGSDHFNVIRTTLDINPLAGIVAETYIYHSYDTWQIHQVSAMAREAALTSWAVAVIAGRLRGIVFSSASTPRYTR